MSAIRFKVIPREQQQTLADKRRREINRTLTIALFMLPGMAVFLIFLLMPVTQSAYFSLYRWNGLGPVENYVQFENYSRLWQHGIFQDALRHTFAITLLALGIQLPIALSLALMIGRGKLAGRKLFRTFFFIPYVFSEPITAIIWLYVFQPSNGLLNNVLGAIIPGFQSVAWIGDRSVVLFSVFAVITWRYFGFHMLLYMAGLQGVPKDTEDAARIDGASEAQVIRHVTLPLMGSTIRLTVFLSVLGSFQQFAIIWLMTQGGPVNASELMATYLYKFGIQRFALGYGSAVAVVLFLTTLIFSIGYQRTIMRQDFSEVS